MANPDRAVHGGAFWEVIDPTFRSPSSPVVPADVLDSWFEPPAALLEEFKQALPFLLRTSPPTFADGMEQVVAQARSVPQESVLAGAGSSALIHLVLRRLLGPSDTIALLEPTYSEYRFVAERIIGARCIEINLSAHEKFGISTAAWVDWICEHEPKVAVPVQPNNPTGTTFNLAECIDGLPRTTTLIVDEAYIDYTDCRSSEGFASSSAQVVVIKTLSKAFGLSGVRAAYAVMHPDLAAELRPWIPPWSVSSVAQWWGCRIWEHESYYREKWQETRALRQALITGLHALPGEVLAEAANWVLWEHKFALPTDALLAELKLSGVFIRDASLTARSLSSRTLRIAVRPIEEQKSLLRALASLADSQGLESSKCGS